jgi:hypothetical protein
MAKSKRGGSGSAERSATSSPRASRSVFSAIGGEGAKAHPHYQDRHEEYILVTLIDMNRRDIFASASSSV